MHRDDIEIPNRPAVWFASARENFSDENLQRGLASLEWTSASKMSFRQFLMLRAYWVKPQDACDFNLSEIVGDLHANKSRRMIESEQYQFFRSYLKTLDHRTSGATTRCAPISCGPFSLVLYQQDSASNKEVPREDGAPKIVISPRYHTRSMTAAAAARQVAVETSPTPAGGQSALTDSLATMNLGKPSTPPESNHIQSSQVETPGSAPGEVLLISNSSPESVETRLSAFSQMSPEQIQAASDEQIVNTALVAFLQAATMYEYSTLGWTLHRNILKMTDLYEARTDGCLWAQNHEKQAPLVILETKAYVRKKNEKQIMIQEAAQMAAWIRQERSGDLPGNTHHSSNVQRRLLISQDGREIYITVGEYDSQYQAYLKDTSEKDPFNTSAHRFDHSDQGPFLKMTCYGPFDIQRADHMKKFAIAVVGITEAFRNM